MSSQGNQNGTANPHQPQPVDYSLPGVMRYLQNEWQRNERDRIQWDLERAEMKTRIAKLEGEKRSLQLLLEGHAKKIAILESCIKKSRDGETDPAFDPYLESKALLEKELSMIQSSEVDLSPIIESRQYLEKCIQEIEYLLQSSNINTNNNTDLEQQGSSPIQEEERIYNQQSRASASQQQQQTQQQQSNQQSRPRQGSGGGKQSKTFRKLSDQSSKPLIKETIPNDWQFLTEFNGHLEPIRGMAFASFDSLITGADDGTIQHWKFNPFETSSIHTDIKSFQTHRGHQGIVSSIAYDPETELLYSAGQDSYIRVWKESQVREIKSILAHDGTICDLSIHSASKKLVSASEDGTAKVWKISNILDRRPICVIRAPGSKEDGTSIKAKSDSSSNQLASSQLGSSGPSARTVLLLSKGNQVAVGYENGQIILYNIKSGSPTFIRELKPQKKSSITDSGVNKHHGEFPTSSPYKGGSRGKKRVASIEGGTEDQQEKMNEAKNKEASTDSESMNLPERDDDDDDFSQPSVCSLTYSKETDQIIALYSNGIARAFDLASGTVVVSWSVHEEVGSDGSLDTNPEGNELVTGGGDGSIKYWSWHAASKTWVMSHEIKGAHSEKAQEKVLKVLWYKGVAKGDQTNLAITASSGGDASTKVYTRIESTKTSK